MASLRKKAAGWEASVFVKGQRESRSFDTKAAAQAWAVQREAELRSLADGQGSKTHTVGDVLDRYQREVSRQKRGKRWEIYRLELIGKREIDSKPFRSIRLADLKVPRGSARASAS
ncbi:integrase/recombinase [Cupriavidus basilensis OR16]|uniref:Integrase/recombinase n=1 Tax=Cupriavidus basilensis OR16 TaxID=1127483 RepID=H1SB63_9BURK|nr:hypothetical protein [Cupriavidus basilensis]EHP40301.1 integrase/recombinase [Cupriavidus basilensis OR16]